MTSEIRRKALANALRKRKGTRPEYNKRDYRRRAAALVASGAKCVVCGKPATTANHRRLISKGGKLSDGLNAMCLKCASAQGGRAS